MEASSARRSSPFRWCTTRPAQWTNPQYHHAFDSDQFTGREIVLSIRRCKADCGDTWPREHEFYDYGLVRRFRASSDPRVPSMAAVRRIFGTYDAAVAEAQRPHTFV